MMTLLLVAANLAIYLLELSGNGQLACETYGLVPAKFAHSGMVEPLFSSLFLHDPTSFSHIAGNMVFLLVFGIIVERSFGAIGFLALYFLAGVAGGLTHVLVDPTSVSPLVGASGAICGVLAVAGILRPRLLGFVISFALLNVWDAVTGNGGNVSFGAHIGGFCCGVVVVLLLRMFGSEALEAA